jgi:hypothetical protein
MDSVTRFLLPFYYRTDPTLNPLRGPNLSEIMIFFENSLKYLILSVQCASITDSEVTAT